MKRAAWSETEAGLQLRARLTPRGGRDAIDGLEARDDGGFVLRCRVRSAPTAGAANAALIAMLAKALAVPKSAISISQGASSRSKTLFIEGNGAALALRLSELTA